MLLKTATHSRTIPVAKSLPFAIPADRDCHGRRREFKWLTPANVAALGTWLARRSQIAGVALVTCGPGRAGGLLPGHGREGVLCWAELPNGNE